MTNESAKTTNNRTIKAGNGTIQGEIEWNYAHFHFRHTDKPIFVEAVLIDGVAWYLVRDVAQLLSELISDTYTHDVEEMIKIETIRMITHEGTSETRRFIPHDEFARLLLSASMSFVA